MLLGSCTGCCWGVGMLLVDVLLEEFGLCVKYTLVTTLANSMVSLGVALSLHGA